MTWLNPTILILLYFIFLLKTKHQVMLIGALSGIGVCLLLLYIKEFVSIHKNIRLLKQTLSTIKDRDNDRVVSAREERDMLSHPVDRGN